MTFPVASTIPLPRSLPSVLGVGAYLKNALGLIQGNEAWLSRENGSLDNVAAIEAFQKTVREMIGVAAVPPVAVAHDWHPDFPSTRWAVESGLKCVPIQHHHAHIAAIMAENGIEEPVLGLALDGFGLGEGGQAWGGELLLVDRTGFRRLGHLRPLPQPGGDAAARQPWRMGAAALWAMGRSKEIPKRYEAFPRAAFLPAMMDKGLNAPLTTSAGRLFDAACGLLGVRLEAAFEGEAPMELERIAGESSRESRIDSRFWRIDSMILDPLPLLEKLADMEMQEGAALFHDALAAALLDWSQKASAETGIKNVALGGGCFLNKRLRAALVQGMMRAGLTPLLPQKLPPGDKAIALGQAVAAAWKIEKESL